MRREGSSEGPLSGGPTPCPPSPPAPGVQFPDTWLGAQVPQGHNAPGDLFCRQGRSRPAQGGGPATTLSPLPLPHTDWVPLPPSPGPSDQTLPPSENEAPQGCYRQKPRKQGIGQKSTVEPCTCLQHPSLPSSSMGPALGTGRGRVTYPEWCPRPADQLPGLSLELGELRVAVTAPSASTGRVALLCARPGALGRRAAAAWVVLGPGGQPLAGGHFQQLQRLADRAALGHLREGERGQ